MKSISRYSAEAAGPVRGADAAAPLSQPGSPPTGRARCFCGKNLALWGALQGEGVGLGAGCTLKQVQVQGRSGVTAALTACPPLFLSGADLETSGSWAPVAHSSIWGHFVGQLGGWDSTVALALWGGHSRGRLQALGCGAAAAGLNLGTAGSGRPARAPGHSGPCSAASASPEVRGAPPELPPCALTEEAQTVTCGPMPCHPFLPARA